MIRLVCNEIESDWVNDVITVSLGSVCTVVRMTQCKYRPTFVRNQIH